MPRASDGTVTLVVGNPVVTDTDITSDWANTTIADLAAMIEDSLSRSGYGGMLAAMRFANGTVGAPGIAFSNDVDTGIYLNAVGDMRLGVASGDVLILNTTGVQVATGKTLDAGSIDRSGTISIGATSQTGLTLGRSGQTTTIYGMARASLPTVGQQISSSCGSFSTSAGVFADVTNLSVTITTTGRPVVLSIISDGNGTDTSLLGTWSSGPALTNILSDFIVLRGATEVARWSLGCGGASSAAIAIYSPPPGVVLLDPVGAGTYTYKVQARNNTATTTASVGYCKFAAYEL